MATEFIAKAVTPEGLVFRKPVTFLVWYGRNLLHA